MLTSEVRKWLDKVNCGSYSYYDAMDKFAEFAPILTKEEILMIRDKIKENINVHFC